MEPENELQKKQFGKMTTEPVGKLLFTLSVPTIISMMVTNIYNLVDTAFVGTLGTSESGATGIVFGYMAILQAVAFMCGQGAGSIMSRKRAFRLPAVAKAESQGTGAGNEIQFHRFLSIFCAGTSDGGSQSGVYETFALSAGKY